MANLKVVDGNVRYMLKTFDGSYVYGSMSEAEANILAKKAKEDGSVPGFELVSGNYRLETEQIVLKFNKSPKKEKKA